MLRISNTGAYPDDHALSALIAWTAARRLAGQTDMPLLAIAPTTSDVQEQPGHAPISTMTCRRRNPVDQSPLDPRTKMRLPTRS